MRLCAFIKFADDAKRRRTNQYARLPFRQHVGLDQSFEIQQGQIPSFALWKEELLAVGKSGDCGELGDSKLNRSQ